MELNDLMQALKPSEASYLAQLLSDPIKRIEAHSDVELTAEEICEALIKAKSAKYTRQQFELNMNYRQEQSKILTQPFSPEEQIQYGAKFFKERFGKDFLIDDQNRDLIRM